VPDGIGKLLTLSLVVAAWNRAPDFLLLMTPYSSTQSRGKGCKARRPRPTNETRVKTCLLPHDPQQRGGSADPRQQSYTRRLEAASPRQTVTDEEMLETNSPDRTAAGSSAKR